MSLTTPGLKLPTCNDENHLADRNHVYTQATSSRPAQYHHDIPRPSTPLTCSPLRFIHLNPAAFRIWRAAPGAPPPIRKPPRPVAHRPVHLRRWTQKRIASRLCFTIDAALHPATPQLTVVQRTTHTYASPHARNPPASVVVPQTTPAVALPSSDDKRRCHFFSRPCYPRCPPRSRCRRLLRCRPLRLTRIAYTTSVVRQRTSPLAR